MSKTYILFWFDVEDFINEESEEGLLGLLDVLDRRGVIGIFKFVGEKIRMLERRGRYDLIERLKAHEVGYHTNLHSIHPVTTEYLEPLGFVRGAEEFELREGGGFADLQRITGQPVLCYGQPGAAWAPQPYPVLRKWGIPVYLDSHDQIQFDGKPFWYGGMLNLTSLTGLMTMPLEDGMLEKAKQRFEQVCEAQKDEPATFISLFYHPTEFVFSEFWDGVNFSKGNNPPPEEWVKPPQRSAEDTAFYLEQVGAFIDYTLSKGNVEYIGVERLLQVEISQSRALTVEEVRRFAEGVNEDVQYLVHDQVTLSAGELFWVFRQALLGQELLPQVVYGPERWASTDGHSANSASKVKVSDVIDALRTELPEVCGFKQLPDFFQVGHARVSPESMTCLMADIIRSERDPDEECTIPNARLAAIKHALNDGKWTRYWSIFEEGLEVRNIVNMSRLQTWTLKPALF